jgi:hypothetical protein
MDIVMGWPGKILCLVAGGLLYKDIEMALFVQTFIFIQFNGVITMQYVLWVVQFMPILFMDPEFFKGRMKKTVFAIYFLFWICIFIPWEVLSSQFYNHGGVEKIEQIMTLNYIFFGVGTLSMAYWMHHRNKFNLANKKFAVTPT